MRKFHAVVILLCSAFLCAPGCEFLQKKDRDAIQEMGKGEYVMLADVEVNPERNVVLRKGDTVTLKIVSGTEWVKVYGYNAALERVSAPQVLILYMYSTDFKDEKFFMPAFEEAFYKLLKRKTDAKPEKKAKR